MTYRNTLLASAAIAVLGLFTAAPAFASIALSPTDGQSEVQATAAFDSGSGTQVTTPVNALPFTTPTVSTVGTASSTVTSALSSTSLSFGFSQSVPDSASQASGEGFVFFTPVGATTYSIFGNLALTGTGSVGEFYVELENLTLGTDAYFTDTFPNGPGTVALDASGGSLTGSLIAGDSYELDAYEGLFGGGGIPSAAAGLQTAAVGNPAGLSGTVTVGFSSSAVPIPEPAAIAIFGVGLIGLAAAHRRS